MRRCKPLFLDSLSMKCSLTSCQFRQIHKTWQYTLIRHVRLFCHPTDCSPQSSSAMEFFQTRATAVGCHLPTRAQKLGLLPVSRFYHLLLLRSPLQSCHDSVHSPTDGSPSGSAVLGFSGHRHWGGLPFPSPIFTVPRPPGRQYFWLFQHCCVYCIFFQVLEAVIFDCALRVPGWGGGPSRSTGASGLCLFLTLL